MLNLYDKMVMDSNTADAEALAKRKIFKHIGMLTETKTPVVILFRTVPGEPENCLVVAPKFLSADYQDSLQKAVESPEGQTSNELGEYLPRQMFADGVNMMGYLHNNNFIKKMATSDITVTYGASKDGEIVLSELNKAIAKDKGVEVSELAIKETDAEVTTIATAKKVTDAKKSKKK